MISKITVKINRVDVSICFYDTYICLETSFEAKGNPNKKHLHIRIKENGDMDAH